MTSPRALLVLGMHRSGTSALAGALAATGVWLGDDLLDAQQDVNDKGFWEHRELVAINEALLAEAGCRWFTPGVSDAVRRLMDTGVPAELRARADRLAGDLLAGQTRTALKDPRLCLMADFWCEVLRGQGAEVALCHLVRHPAEVARSLDRRDGITAFHANALWLEYVGAAVRASNGSVKTLTGDYDTLMKAPESLLERLARMLDWPLEATAATGTGVEPSLRHHRHSEGDAPGLLGPEATAMFAALIAGGTPDPEAADRVRAQHAEALAEVGRAFDAGNRAVVELHEARHLIAERDGQLRERADQLDRLGREHEKALSTIAERDRQAREAWQRLEKLGREHEQALATVAERDRQLEERWRELERIGQLHSHAQEVVRERDAELARVSGELAEQREWREQFDRSRFGRLYHWIQRLRRR